MESKGFLPMQHWLWFPTSIWEPPSRSARLFSKDTWRKIEKKRTKGKEENCATTLAMPRTFGVYQSRGCRIREKRAELTVERVYVKSSTVIDSLPSSILLRVDHEGRRAGWYARVVWDRKGGSGGGEGGLLVFRPSALGTPVVPRRTLPRSFAPFTSRASLAAPRSSNTRRQPGRRWMGLEPAIFCLASQ